MNVKFITGIDTEIGKTYVTGLIAKYLQKKGVAVTTQKLVQTGCRGISTDIQAHRQIMEIPLTDEDYQGTTCPYIFAYPASPYLAATMEHQMISLNVISEATQELMQKYDMILIEGSGGIYVPINEDATLLDYLVERKYPLILVTSSKLGSINHTLMSLDIIKQHGLHLDGLVYNRFNENSTEIGDDSIKVFRHFLKKHGFPDVIIEIPHMDYENSSDIDFSPLFK